MMAVESIFLFSIVWGMGISLRDEMKKKFQDFLQK